MGKDSHALATGLFMVILITGIVIIVIWLGDIQRQTQTYIAETRNSVTGLKIGSTVYYRGIAVGKVSDMRFDPVNPELIIVSLDVNKEVKFTRGVYAMLELKGVTGLTKIALKDSGDNAELLPSGSNPENRIPIRPSFIDRLSVSGENTVRQTHELLLRLNRLLEEGNIRHVTQILSNLDSATGRFNSLQDSAEKVLAELPSLTTDAHQTLAKIDGLAGEFKQLSHHLQKQLLKLSQKTGAFMQAGTSVSEQLQLTTLPKANALMVQMQAAIRRFDRIGAMLEAEPQAFLLGTEALQPAPGEPGFKRSQ